MTAQNTLGVHAVHPVPLDFIARQIEVVLTDIGADVIKTGMLGNSAVIATVCAALDRHAAGIPVVVDPVMVAKGGHPLLAAEAVDAMRRQLLPRAAVITPNLPEAEALSGMTHRDRGGHADRGLGLAGAGRSRGAAEGRPSFGRRTGRFAGDSGWGGGVLVAPHIHTRHTHGTGCSTASAVAAGLAQGMSLRDAVVRARAYVRAAIASAPELGGGHGPLNHAVTVDMGRLTDV